jgi:predicted Zn-dependent protease
VYLLGQDADAAMKEFKHELEISPSHFPSMVQLAFEYLKRDEYEQALTWAEKGVQLAPKLYAARNVLGRALLELGQVDRAVKELEAGVALAPGSPEMHFALARAYTRAGRKQDAARARETFKKLEEQFNADRARRDNLKPGGPDNDQPRAKP